MSKQDAQAAYEELKKYITASSRDAFLRSAEGSGQPGSYPAKKKDDSKGLQDDPTIKKIYDDFFASSQNQASFEQIAKKIHDFAISKKEDKNLVKEIENIFTFTPYTADAVGNYWSIPYNSTGNTNQGTHSLVNDTTMQPGAVTYTAKSITKNIPESSRIDVIQSWLADLPTHAADSDINAVFLSTLTNVAMSQAVPYVDILISTGIDADSENFAPFSLGSFLGINNKDDVMFKSKFKDAPGSSVVKANIGKKTLGAVASMEIFTTPQTLVNATGHLGYNEMIPGRIDPFRPFMALEAFNVQTVSSGHGFLQKKTADMKIILFDKGRLSDIAMLVSPMAYNTVQLDITYGWAHPAGNLTAGRSSDAKFDDKIGKMIDAMRVTDTFTVVNNNMVFNPNGTVSIDLKLVCTGMDEFSTKEIKLSDKSNASVTEINNLMMALSSKINNLKSDLNFPVSLTSGNANSIVSLDEKERESLRKLTHSLSKHGKKTIVGLDSVIADIAALIGEKNKDKAGTETGKVYAYRDSREKEVDDFIKELTSTPDTPDPFIRTHQKIGVTDELLIKDSYVSLGKILVKAIASDLSQTAEVMMIFGCFNQNAAGVRDHNISQFPILLKSGDKNKITLQKVLTKYLKDNTTMSPQDFIRILIDNFIENPSNLAYGLSGAFSPDTFNSKEGRPEYAKGVAELLKQEDGGLALETAKLNNLASVYHNLNLQNVSSPIFTVPKVTMEITSRRAAGTNEESPKSIIRVNIFDAAHDPSKPVSDLLMDVLRDGYVLDPPQTDGQASNNIRVPRHGKTLSSFYKSISSLLVSRDVFHDETPKTSTPADLKARDALNAILEKDYKNAKVLNLDNFGKVTFIRNLFYDYFPTLIVGSMGSGILSANLSSQQNDALKTQAISRAINGNSEGLPEKFSDFGMVLYPTQLTMDVFGSPLFKYMQRYFVDFGTNTSADNIYMLTGITLNFSPGSFKTNLRFSQNDAFGRTINIKKTAASSLMGIVQAQKDAKEAPATQKKKKGK